MNRQRAIPSTEVPESVQGKCVFCLRNGRLQEEQILLRGSFSYLCAPRGQLLEGFLLLVPFRCIGSLSQLPRETLDELSKGRAIVENFYLVEYGVTDATFYEQGRGGGGARMETAGGFPFHAHLCGLPAACDLHSVLEEDYSPRVLFDFAELPAVTGGSPYVYASSVDGCGVYRHRAYVADCPVGQRRLEHARFKPVVAERLGLPERGNWRAYPGDRRLVRLLRRFRAYQRRTDAVL